MPGTHLLPPNLLKLFAPRPPLPYTRPVDKDIDRVREKRVTGVGSILMSLREANAMNASIDEEDKPSLTLAEETKRQIRREATRRKKEEEFKRAQEAYKPADDPEAIGDPYKTLFISRLHKSATEADLRREFEGYGTIERVRIVRDKKGRSRGYAFIVYERERDMKAAYKESDGLHIMGKRILVDVERGRTVRGWKPRRLGGGLGGRPKKVVDQAPVGRPGFRGGFGGGYRGRGGGGGGRGYDRGGHGGDRGGHGGDRGGHGGGERGGFRGGGYGSFRSGRDEFGGGFRGRGRGLGYGGGGGGYPDHTNGYGAGGGSGYGGPPGGNQGYGSHGGYSGGGGYRGDYKRDGPPGYDDRDPKRPRY